MKNILITFFIVSTMLVGAGFVAYQTDVATVYAWGGGGAEGGGENGTYGGNGCGGCNSTTPITTPTPPYTPPTPPPPPTPIPTCTISSSPSSIEQGNSSTISWSSSNASSASINQGIGAVSTSGSRSVTPGASTTYNVTVNGAGGSVSCSTGIIVTQPPVVVPTCTLSANPTNVDYNGSSNLSWTSSDATNASINNGIGPVGVSGSYSISNLTSNKNYTLIVNGAGGSATCSAPVVVNPQPPVVIPSCTLSADSPSVESGKVVTLNWGSTNSTSATLTTVGSVDTVGSYSIYPQSSRNYVLTVYGANGTSRSCSQYVSVYKQPVYQQPSCTIRSSKGSVEYGNPTTLTWNSYNAVSANITNVTGYTPLAGSRVVYPNGATNYTMTVSGASGENAICTTSVGIYVPRVYEQQPIVREYVTISNIPYTGANDLPYILALLAVALASIAGMVYYRGSIAAAFGFHVSTLAANNSTGISYNEITENEADTHSVEGDRSVEPALSVSNGEDGPKLTFKAK